MVCQSTCISEMGGNVTTVNEQSRARVKRMQHPKAQNTANFTGLPKYCKKDDDDDDEDEDDDDDYDDDDDDDDSDDDNVNNDEGDGAQCC